MTASARFVGTASLLVATLCQAQSAPQPPDAAAAHSPVIARNVVLVHGAWADGSSWAAVIARLQATGLHVTAVQNPLTSLADSVAETRRILAQQNGPTVLVAHSWGGTVISDVGDDPRVSALVYVAARAPDAGEDFVALSSKFPTMPVRAGIETHDGFTTIKEDAFLSYFANGVAHDQAQVLYAVQEPTAATIFSGRTSAAAWHTKPTWYAVSKQDETISPDPRALSRQAYERDPGGVGCGPPFLGFSPEGGLGSDSRCGGEDSGEVIAMLPSQGDPRMDPRK